MGPTGLKSRCHLAYIPSEGSKGEHVASRGYSQFLLMRPALLRSQQRQAKFSGAVPRASILLSCLPLSLKDPCDYIGSTQVIQVNLPIFRTSR